MKKHIACSVFILLLLVSCGNSQQQKPLPEVRSGMDGLAMEFVKNAPPAVIFESTSFPAILRVKNIGAYSISKDASAILSLAVERDYTIITTLETSSRVEQGSDKNEAKFSVEGKSIVNTKGDEEVISYTLTAGKLEPQSETHISNVIASICYPYSTELVTSVCIDTDPNGLRPIKKSCSQENLPFSAGQGAPVAITSIEVFMLPSADTQQIVPQFYITIENKGKGEVAHRNTFQQLCQRSANPTQGSISYQDFNTLFITASLSNEKLTCALRDQASKLDPNEKEGIVRLKSKKDVVRCFGNPVNMLLEAYTAPLKVQLDYGYTQSLATEYTIRKPVR